jgi:uncharacterized protein DUF4328
MATPIPAAMNISTAPARYRSPRTLAKLLTAAFVIYVAGLGWFALSIARLIGYLSDVEAGRAIDQAAFMRLATAVDGRAPTLVALQVAGIVMFLWWMHRVAANLRAFGIDSVPPSSAVGSFFIPILNLWKPYLVLVEIWISSTPPPSPPSYKPIQPSSFLLLWWLTWTASRIANIFIFELSPKSEPSEVISYFHACLAVFALETFALLMMFAVVWGLTRLQDRRAATGLAAATVVDR